jgi:uncharacterized protein YecA (UPF0149 family)
MGSLPESFRARLKATFEDWQARFSACLKEAQKAGWSLEDALKETIVRNWQSFKAEWVDKNQVGGYQHVNKQEALEASNRAVVERFLMKDMNNA